MSLKAKFRTVFPAAVKVLPPLTLVKHGMEYIFGIDVTAISADATAAALEYVHTSVEPRINALDTSVGTLQTEVDQLQAAQAGSGVGFASKAAMDAAVGSHAQGDIAYCYDSDPSLRGVYIHQAGASWGTRVALLPNDAAAALDLALREIIPTPTKPVVLFRLSATDWLIRTPIGNGQPGEYIEWRMRDIAATISTTRCINLASIATNENGQRRIFSDYTLHGGSVFEFAFNVGLMTDPLGPLWGFYGNGHGNIAYTGLSITMDGGPNIRDMDIGYVTGTSLTIDQTFNIKLPKDGSIIGTIDEAYIYNTSGCLVSHTHTITAANIGNQNSYSAMLPISGCDKAQFGSNPVMNINLFDGSQSANQGQNSSIEAWNSARPDLKLKMSLPTGTPGSPDGWSHVTTTDEFAQNQNSPPSYTKIYINYRSGNTAVAAVNSSHATQYQVHK